MDYAEIANKWRSEQSEPRYTEGVVLIWKNQVYGWKNTLRDARHERPGAIAVDTDGRAYMAEGGDDSAGAKCWVAMGSNISRSKHRAKT